MPIALNVKIYTLLKQGLTMANNATSAKTVIIIIFSVHKHSSHKSSEIKKMAIDMYLEGLGFFLIGRVLNISYGTVYQWVKKLGGQHQDCH